MDIRCGSCSKLFRVADEKIAGKGIRFKCSRCGETVTVTKDDFERDKASSEPVIPTIPVHESVPAVPSPPPPPVAPEKQAQEFQAQEYTPPPASTGMGEFDFTEPHAAAAAGMGEAALGGEFSFGDMGGQEEQAAPEISISEEDAQEAESAAFQFPTDIISEPKPLPGAKDKAETEPAAKSEDFDLGAALAMPSGAESAEPSEAAPVISKPVAPPATPLPEPETKEEEEMDLGAALAIPKSAPQAPPAATVETPKPTPAPSMPAPAVPKPTPPVAMTAPVSEADEEMDLGAALSMPTTESNENTDAATSEGGAEESAAAASEAEHGEGISPFASGNLTGAVAGFLCALPAIYFLTLGFDISAGLFPVLTALPGWYLLAVSGTGMLGLGIVIGMVIAFLQAQTGRRLFFLLNILIAALFGAFAGAAMSSLIALASGTGVNLERLQAYVTLWGGVSFVIGSVLALARAVLVRNREETFAADLTGLQKFGLALSGLAVLAALYGAGTFGGQMEQAEQTLAKQRQDAMKKQASVITPDGLAVVNAVGYVDPATGDLVISGTVQNVTDTPKQGWYLETEVYDSGLKVLSAIRVLNGVQLFTQHDRDVLTRRKENIDALREKMLQLSGGGAVPVRGSVPFEIRLYEPQKEMTSFLPLLKRFSMTGKSGPQQR